MRGWRLAVASLAAVCTACSLVVPFDGLADDPGSAPDGAVAETAASDASGERADAAPIDPDLVAWWPFDEGSGNVARDATSNGNDGLLAPGAIWVAGKKGGALSFDGSSRIVVATNPSHATVTTGLTFAAWLSPDGNLEAPRLIQFGGSWEVKLNGGQPQLSASPRYAIASWRAPLREWHHIALTFDRGTAGAFVDGVAVPIGTNQFTTTQPLPTGDQGVAVGGVIPGGADQSCRCILDDVRVYRRRLSNAEIAALAR